MLFALYVKIRSILNQWFDLKYDFLNFFENNIRENSYRWIFYNVVCFSFQPLKGSVHVFLQEINLKKCRPKMVREHNTFSYNFTNIWYRVVVGSCSIILLCVLDRRRRHRCCTNNENKICLSVNGEIRPKTEQKNSSHTWLCLSSICCDVYSDCHFFRFSFSYLLRFQINISINKKYFRLCRREIQFWWLSISWRFSLLSNVLLFFLLSFFRFLWNVRAFWAHRNRSSFDSNVSVPFHRFIHNPCMNGNVWKGELR